MGSASSAAAVVARRCCACAPPTARKPSAPEESGSSARAGSCSGRIGDGILVSRRCRRGGSRRAALHQQVHLLGAAARDDQEPLELHGFAARLAEVVEILDLAPYIWLPTPYVYTAWWPWVKNYAGELRAGSVRPGPIYARMWVDQEMKKKMGH